MLYNLVLCSPEICFSEHLKDDICLDGVQFIDDKVCLIFLGI
jgi:hypothetical protein